MDGREVNLNPNNPSSFNNNNNNNYPILRDVQAAFKRHRKMPINNMQPRRLVVPRRETVTMVNHETASITLPSILNTPTEDGNVMGVDDQRGEVGLRCDCRSNNMFAQPCLKCRQVVDPPKKVQFVLGNDTRSHGSDDHMDTRTTNVLTHMGSLALTEMERDVNNRVDVSAAPSHDANEQNVYNMDIDISSRSNDEISSLLSKGTAGVQKHVSPLRNFLQSDFGHQMTSSSVVGSTCATTTLVNSVNAPMLSSTSHCSKQSQQGSFNAGNSFDMNYHRMTQIDTGNPPKFSSKVLADQNPSAAVNSYPENKHALLRDQQGNEAGSCDIPKDPPPLADNSQPPISSDQISNVKSVTSKSGKSEKPASKKDPSAPRKRSYDPDLFFKVNGKLYQRLGKIGSGGSSEVHKVISQDCTIYALKKIKLKGRDYATAYGFCQEIEYLNKLKGKDHIIQLIDYEVTDKALLKEVLSGSMSIKDGRVKDDGCIFMVLEYGEIDLAHMLSQKWRELDDSRSTIDENWLRFYWQQILLAVKTIHEERVVHSDLKPANFLLVRGSLKLIDFGIAKAILSDTTNIQRDSQVGTLSYMSPEAFMCNETDANGNIIKCGRPSDIWSLGCILYQMVYGRTPFADYTTFWAKFKVITDPNHEIHYEPLSNLWLLDLIKKCLAWDRKERWTIPQLLQHPFLVPPIPPSLSNRNLIELVTDSCSEDPETSLICSRLQQLVSDPIPNIKSVGSGSLTLDQKCTLLDEVSKLCLQLKEQLAYS